MCRRDLENANYHTRGKWKQVKTVSIVLPNLRFLNRKIQNTLLFCGPITTNLSCLFPSTFWS